MATSWCVFIIFLSTKFAISSDFYAGLFRNNDFLVAQDTVHKPANPFGYAIASYGRLFKCRITYFRVIDIYGVGRGPKTSIVRGGLGKKYIAVRIKSTYNLPIAVKIYVGCENKAPKAPMTLKPKIVANATNTTDDATGEPEGDKPAGEDGKDGGGGDAEEGGDKGGGEEPPAEEGEQPPAEEGEEPPAEEGEAPAEGADPEAE